MAAELVKIDLVVRVKLEPRGLSWSLGLWLIVSDKLFMVSEEVGAS